MARTVSFVLLGLILSLMSLFFIRGSENAWMCVDGTWVKHGNPSSPKPSIPCMKKSGMTLVSPAFEDGENIPPAYTCDGEGVSPPLHVSDVPPDTESLALTIDDPDAPVRTFHHLVVWNIDKSTRSIEAGFVPKGAVVGNNSAGVVGYAAACPPFGEHRYVFTVYALDTELILSAGANRSEFDQAASGHIITQASFSGMYKRK